MWNCFSNQKHTQHIPTYWLTLLVFETSTFCMVVSEQPSHLELGAYRHGAGAPVVAAVVPVPSLHPLSWSGDSQWATCSQWLGATWDAIFWMLINPYAKVSTTLRCFCCFMCGCSPPDGLAVQGQKIAQQIGSSGSGGWDAHGRPAQGQIYLVAGQATKSHIRTEIDHRISMDITSIDLDLFIYVQAILGISSQEFWRCAKSKFQLLYLKPQFWQSHLHCFAPTCCLKTAAATVFYLPCKANTPSCCTWDCAVGAFQCWKKHPVERDFRCQKSAERSHGKTSTHENEKKTIWESNQKR